MLRPSDRGTSWKAVPEKNCRKFISGAHPPSVKMGKFKKEKQRIARESAGSSNAMANVKVKGENFYRDAKKVKKVNMYKDGKPVRNAKGEIIKAAPFQSKEIPKARVEPNRRWFGSTRVIAQDALAEFRERIGSKIGDPYQVLLRRNKLPLSLLQESASVISV
jgi:nuclear GTP-binding protein